DRRACPCPQQKPSAYCRKTRVQRRLCRLPRRYTHSLLCCSTLHRGPDSYGSRASSAHGLPHKKRPPSPRRSGARAELPLSANGFDAWHGRVSSEPIQTVAKNAVRSRWPGTFSRTATIDPKRLPPTVTPRCRLDRGIEASQVAVVSVPDCLGLAQRLDINIELDPY